MASITITFTDAQGTNAYQHDFTDAALDRIVTAMRSVYGTYDDVQGSPTFGQLIPLSKSLARKTAVRGVVSGWKDLARRFDEETAAAAAKAAVAPIDSTEV